MMDINRNQFFLAGVLIVLLGAQFRMVDSFVVTPGVAKMASKRRSGPTPATRLSIQTLVPINKPAPTRTVRPPEWLGYSLLSVGAVLVLHSLAMRKPEGG